ncbi:ActS/PrrB/RegB family redox-sensitive histidine kinase [Aestuariispira insulae]|uniref:histidine kinase n=1 Tax=Aestuariispira insulae TaxID=1461337 RepID=A0A3D9HDX5_9PROT|nr:ActS/PrrB/RegB family redox-sensitive histidine kinase [Aestuariispira insulae]RED47670.1 two-component system sensor histidine kinase RegB [Aestuariispira insulae]
MPQNSTGIRPQTLVLLRWIAAAGQSAAVLATSYLLGFELPVFECLGVIGMLVLSNLVIGMGRTRLTGYHVTRILVFDIAQLTALIYLTGGLQNPFSLLILVPVTVSATMLSKKATIGLSVVALLAVSFLAFQHRPLPWSGTPLEIPMIYVIGIWTAVSVAIVFTTIYLWSLMEESRRTAKALAEAESALTRQQRMSDLGGLAAAAAHELGSPLATIAVVAKELSNDVPEDSPLAEDIELLISQSDRCREILASLRQRPETKGGAPYEQVLLTDLAQEILDTYLPDGVTADLAIEADNQGGEPEFTRKPELVQGLGNVIQNAGQFAKNTVSLQLFWNEDEVRITIRDDGPGFPRQVLDSIGEPYISTRTSTGNHMGLGIFIAKTLLERVGARVLFRNLVAGNGMQAGGAQVMIRWKRDVFDTK